MEAKKENEVGEDDVAKGKQESVSEETVGSEIKETDDEDKSAKQSQESNHEHEQRNNTVDGKKTKTEEGCDDNSSQPSVIHLVEEKRDYPYLVSMTLVWILTLATRLYKIDDPPHVW